MRRSVAARRSQPSLTAASLAQAGAHMAVSLAGPGPRLAAEPTSARRQLLHPRGARKPPDTATPQATTAGRSSLHTTQLMD